MKTSTPTIIVYVSYIFGYTLFGSELLTYKVDGKWDNHIPNCLYIYIYIYIYIYVSRNIRIRTLFAVRIVRSVCAFGQSDQKLGAFWIAKDAKFLHVDNEGCADVYAS